MTSSTPDISAFRKSIINSLDYMNNNPRKLEEHPDEMIDRLIEYMETNGQSSGNEVKAHEACLAVIFEANGFNLAPRNVVPADDGMYYWYQPAGSQKSGDFLLFRTEAGTKKDEVLFDAKHTNLANFYLNDGWFNKDTIYVISFSVAVGRGIPRKKICFVGLGQDIPTDNDTTIMNHYNDFKKAENAKRKNMKPDFLLVYVRFANQYSTKQFTPDFTAHRFYKTVEWLQSYAEPSL